MGAKIVRGGGWVAVLRKRIIAHVWVRNVVTVKVGPTIKITRFYLV